MIPITAVEPYNNRFTLSQPYEPTYDLLAGRVILVTGAGIDLGEAAARAFAAHGASVVLLGQDVAALESVYDRIVEAGGPEPAIYPLNLLGATSTDYEELTERVDAEFGRLDGILHASVELGVPSPIEHYDVAEWAKAIHVNLHAPFLLTQACLPMLKRAGDASIIFTSADVGRRGRAYWGAYGVSVFAIDGFLQILADEVDSFPGLRANAVDPGAVRTRFRATAYPGEDPNTLPSPDELTPIYLFLMGHDSLSINGVVVASCPEVGVQRSPCTT